MHGKGESADEVHDFYARPGDDTKEEHVQTREESRRIRVRTSRTCVLRTQPRLTLRFLNMAGRMHNPVCSNAPPRRGRLTWEFRP